MEIKTNNHSRQPLMWEELSPKEQAEFDWMSATDRSCAEFVRYKGWVYLLSEFAQWNSAVPNWDGYHSDTYFSGIVVRFVDHGERVILGTYYS